MLGPLGRRLPGPARITCPVSFHAGPGVALADLVDEASEICNGGSVFVASAWSSADGARLLWDITDGRVRIEGLLIGVARRGTDRAALYAAKGVAESAYVYLDGNTQGQIAHFKVMRFKGPGKRIAIVGSGNLTRGGLLDNQEACVVLFDDGAASGPLTSALNDVDRFLDDKVRSGYAHFINEALIARLVATGTVPVKHTRSHADTHTPDPNRDESETPSPSPRRVYVYQRGTPPFVVPPFQGPEPPDYAPPEGAPPVPARASLRRFVKYFGIGESNRIKRLKGELPGDVGTHYFNLSKRMSEPEREFWGYPALFSLDADTMEEERFLSVRFRVGNRSQVISGGAKPPGVFLRLRKGRDNASRIFTEVRFRPVSLPAMRQLYDGIDVPPTALLVVERGNDVDFEARVVLPTDAEYANLAPASLRQQIYT